MMNPMPVVRAALARNRFTSLLFVALIALAVALGIAISAQERALRQGSARAADKFDLIVSAPGSHNDVLFSVVYLNPVAVELLSPEMTAKALNEPRAAFAAPVGFGDSYGDSPVVGTTAPFIDYFSGGLAEGRAFVSLNEAVIGALAPGKVGDRLAIGHGQGGATGDADSAVDEHDDADGHDHGDEDDHADGHDHNAGRDDGEGHDHAEGHDHEHTPVVVVGRMKPTGTPWDRAIVVPIEYNWKAHGLPVGHAPDDARIGPPFDAAHLPGAPAVIMKPANVAAAYGLRSAYRSTQSSAFFPAEALVDIYRVMGNVAGVMGALTLAAQALVVAAILAGVLALLDLQRQRFAVLRALGAPARFVFATVWIYVAALIGAGALIGLPLGWLAATLVSRLVATQTGVALIATIGATELAWVAALVVLGMALALVPAAMIYRRPVVEGLRA